MADAGKLDSPLQLALPQTAQGMAKEIQPYFQDVYDAIYQLQLALVNFVGIAPQPRSIWNQLTALQTVFAQNSNRFYCKASETLATGAMVNLFPSGGVAMARNATATGLVKPAHGFCNVSGGCAAGDYTEIILAHGICPLFSGLIPGQEYFLALGVGLIQGAAVVSAGNLEQFLGVALDANTLFFNSGYYIRH